MAHFRGTVRGSNGATSRLGTKKSGLIVTANAWRAGVKVVGGHDENGDYFGIFVTSGSDEMRNDREFIGRVRETEDGPVFIPEYRP